MTLYVDPSLRERPRIVVVSTMVALCLANRMRTLAESWLVELMTCAAFQTRRTWS